MPILTRPTFTLHYDVRGPSDAAAVVLLPSFLCDASMFTHLAESLEPRYRVFGLDLRGHGRSSTPSRRYTLEEQAEDVIALLDQEGIHGAHWVGLSQGGMTAIRAALHFPDRVRSLVLMDSSAGPEELGVRVRYAALATLFQWIGLAPFIRREVEAKMFSPGFRRSHPEVVARYVERWSQLDRLGVVRSIQAISSRSDLRGRLAEIRPVTLVVCGSEDRALPSEHSRVLAAQIRDARLQIVESAGHLSTIERPEETSALVGAFLDEVTRGDDISS